MPKPETKSSGIFLQLNTLLEAGNASEFQIAKIKADANSLKAVDAFEAYAALAAIACFENDEALMDEYYSKAFKIKPDDVNGLSNYATSLEKVGRLTQAWAIFEKILKLAPDNLAELRSAINFAVGAGRFHGAHALLEKWNKLSPTEKNPFDTRINEVMDVFNKNNVNESDTISALELAINLLNQNGCKSNHGAFSTTENTITHRISVKANVDKVVDLNLELADLFVENGLVPQLSKAMTVLYVPDVR